MKTAQQLATPLVAYYAIALAIPILNGSGRTETHFLEHASFVVLAPLVMVGVLGAVHYGWRRLTGRRSAMR